MPVFRWRETRSLLPDLEREFERLLEGVGFHVAGRGSGRSFPQLNLLEDADSYVVTAELPGHEAKEIEVTVVSGYLSIRGNRRPPAEAEEESFRRRERFHGPWQRRIQLPDRILEEQLRADYVAGILRVTLPKAPSGQPRQITVNEGP